MTMTHNGPQTQKQTQSGIGSPISNEAYNVVAALHSKLEGLEAYRKYAQSGDQQVWQQLTEHDLQGVECLVTELERLVKDGKFRMKTPGKAG